MSKDHIWAWFTYIFLALSCVYGFWNTNQVCSKSINGEIAVSGVKYKCPFVSNDNDE